MRLMVLAIMDSASGLAAIGLLAFSCRLSLARWQDTLFALSARIRNG